MLPLTFLLAYSHISKYTNSPPRQYNSSVEYNNEDENSNYYYKPIENEKNKIK